MSEKYAHNTLIWAALNSICELGSPKVWLYDMEDKYHQPPRFLFRFKNKQKDDELYERVKDVIEHYNGKIQWSMMTHDDMSNYLIYLKPFEPYIASHNTYCEAYLQPLFGDEYRVIVDKALGDVEGLTRALNSISK